MTRSTPVLVLAALFATACAIEYQLGYQYKYLYTTNLSLNRAVSNGSTRASQPVGLSVQADVTLTVVWHKEQDYLVKVEAKTVSASGLTTSKKTKSGLPLSESPVYYQWNVDGSVGKVFVPVDEPLLSANLKKGIISLLQLQTVDGKRTEVDTSGECVVTYRVDGHRVKKFKTSCSPLEKTGLYDHTSKLLSVDAAGVSEIAYEFADDVVTSVDAIEGHLVTVNARRDLSVSLQSRQGLELKSKVQAPSSAVFDISDFDGISKRLHKEHKREFAAMLLGSDVEPPACLRDCTPLADALAKHSKALTVEKLSKVESAQAFAALLPVFRQASKDSIVQAFKKNPSIELQLIDLAAAAQTSAAAEALLAHLDFSSTRSYTKAERYLIAIGFASHPSSSLIRQLNDLFKKNLPSVELRESVGLALGAVANTYCQLPEQCKSEVIREVEQSLSSAYEQCGSDEPCKVRILRAARNARLYGLLPLLLKVTGTAQGTAVAYAAVQAAATTIARHLSKDALDAMSRIYHEGGGRRPLDSSVRAEALNVLLDNHELLTHQQIVNLVLSATNQTDHELATLVLAKLTDLSNSDSDFRARMKQVAKDKRIVNYNSYAAGGKSSALTSLLGKTDGAWATYSLYALNAKSGVMKLSSMNVDLDTGLYRQPMLATEIYAQGLESAIGGDSGGDSGGAEEEATAGMSLRLLDTLLRPIEFFRGTSGLMSAVWNAPSEPVSALAMNILLHDVNQRLHLQNGLVVDTKVLGVASIDLSGAISISLWNRDAHSVVKNSGAVVIQGHVGFVGEAYLNASVDFSLESESGFDFSTDVSFYETPFKICLRMSQEPFKVRQSWHKAEIADGASKKFQAQFSKVQQLGGASFLLNEKNSVECTALLEST